MRTAVLGLVVGLCLAGALSVFGRPTIAPNALLAQVPTPRADRLESPSVGEGAAPGFVPGGFPSKGDAGGIPPGGRSAGGKIQRAEFLRTSSAGRGPSELESRGPNGPANRASEAARPAGELMALSHEAAEGQRQLLLIDPKTRVLAVYHIDQGSGEISLRSVRAIHWDLMMDDFNGASPSPREIRSLTEPR